MSKRLGGKKYFKWLGKRDFNIGFECSKARITNLESNWPQWARLAYKNSQAAEWFAKNYELKHDNSSKQIGLGV